MVLHFVASYAVLEICVAALAVAVSLRRAHRPRHQRAIPVPPGFERTGERFLDPTTRVLQGVWFNPRMGERLYRPLARDEDGPAGGGGAP